MVLNISFFQDSFEEMGFTYIGPLDGHDINELITNFRNADLIEGPVLIHVNTRKGKVISRQRNNRPNFMESVLLYWVMA